MRLNCTFQRRKTTLVRVGKTLIGADSPIRIQSMANTSTDDVEGSVAQAQRMIQAGAELIRFTTQGIREVEHLRLIHQQLGQQVPLVADIHFQSDVADAAAQVVEKVRINPGNYIDPARKFIHLSYTDEEYQAELQRLKERFVRFLNICKTHHTAIRLGVNHGSLSDRIMSRYGDTPEGMVESVMEFLRVAVAEQFTDIVISIKASNTRIMVQTVRLLVQQMDAEKMAFPLHLGVTEAGEGEDGRIKSAVGIGALLADGIGDTVRVSLSEAPEKEIPVARDLVAYFADPHSVRYTNQVVVETDETPRGIVVHYAGTETDWSLFCLQTAAECGRLLWEYNSRELVVTNPAFSSEQLERLSRDILQAAQIIRYKTEFVSCPGCGRTLFELESTIAQVKQALQGEKGLEGLKIAIMGCIVNGPGEMADSDYGYVGAGRGKISLYRGKECVLKNIPQEQAVPALLEIIHHDKQQ